jgi:hypothetical protein
VAKTAMFIEFGDGGFTFNYQPMREFQGPIGPKRILATATAIYDTIQRPPRKVILNVTSTSTDYHGVNQDPILQGKKVKITPSLRSIFPGEELIYVITYRNCGRFVFSYDNQVFEELKPASLVSYDNGMVESIRIHKNEEVSLSTYGTYGLVNVSTHEPVSDTLVEKIFLSLWLQKKFGAIPASLGGQTFVKVDATIKI